MQAWMLGTADLCHAVSTSWGNMTSWRRMRARDISHMTHICKTSFFLAKIEMFPLATVHCGVCHVNVRRKRITLQIPDYYWDN